MSAGNASVEDLGGLLKEAVFRACQVALFARHRAPGRGARPEVLDQAEEDPAGEQIVTCGMRRLQEQPRRSRGDGEHALAPLPGLAVENEPAAFGAGRFERYGRGVREQLVAVAPQCAGEDRGEGPALLRRDRREAVASGVVAVHVFERRRLRQGEEQDAHGHEDHRLSARERWPSQRRRRRGVV